MVQGSPGYEKTGLEGPQATGKLHYGQLQPGLNYDMVQYIQDNEEATLSFRGSAGHGETTLILYLVVARAWEHYTLVLWCLGN